MDPKNSKHFDKTTISTTKEKTSSQLAYLIVHATGEKPLAKCSPFLIQKLFESTIGHLKKIQKLRSGDLLVETASPQQTTKLSTMKTLGDMGILVTPHRSLNSSRGVISEFDLMSEDESDIQIGLLDQGVTSVRRISIRRDSAEEGNEAELRGIACFRLEKEEDIKLNKEGLERRGNKVG
ncbi:uncharacterized protein LOC111637504 [Centruroides sculpturatus]|uniref:uncharacterized protein LOC111637504 n=1 Tax=Centruroides sculpturatus TaxID=218467 RepID=UPI000C6D747B|nr:uncharacterized protein LOC111637504 [Centruroides sculpturatus]